MSSINLSEDLEIVRYRERLHRQQQVRQLEDFERKHFEQVKRRMANTYGYLLKRFYRKCAGLLLEGLDLPWRLLERLTHQRHGWH